MKHILLVDDDQRDLYAMSRVLGQSGYTIHTANDYLSALTHLENTPIDLLVTDVLMPKGMNGFALARMAQMRRRDLKVIYVTGFEVPTTEAVGKVLRKPVADAHLIEEVQSALMSADVSRDAHGKSRHSA